jgi:DNA-binding MarR family transcriptional regulator
MDELVETLQRKRASMRLAIQELTGETETGGIELSSLIHLLANLYESAEVPPGSQLDLSGPRWGLLMRLQFEEARGNCSGITPTNLSRVQSVSKNTISALLRGLEDQGLIQRTLDPQDRRLFRIQLTPHGREVVHQQAPARVRHLNRLTQGLTDTERQELTELMWKLFSSIYHNCPHFANDMRAAALHEEKAATLTASPEPSAPGRG